jgi:hypothetical protein
MNTRTIFIELQCRFIPAVRSPDNKLGGREVGPSHHDRVFDLAAIDRTSIGDRREWPHPVSGDDLDRTSCPA